MPWGAVAGAAISAGVGLYGASKQSSAVSGASNAAVAEQRAGRDAAREDLDPFKWAGQTAARRLENLSGAQGAGAAREAFQDFTADPGYQFRINEGTRAIQNNAAASGAAGGGNVLRALVDYGQGQASQEFSNYYNRLFGLAQMGANAAAGTAQAGVTAGSGIANTLTSAGTAQAGIIGNASAGVSTALNQGLTNMRWNSLMPQNEAGGFNSGGAKAGFVAPTAPAYGVTY